MKKIISFATGLLAASALFAGDMDQVYLGKFTTVQTNAAATAAGKLTNDIPVYGLLKGFVINFSGTEASPDIDIDITTYSSVGSKTETTLYSEDDVTADGQKPVRQQAVNTAGVAPATTNQVEFMLVGDKFIISAYDANTNAGINVEAWAVIEK